MLCRRIIPCLDCDLGVPEGRVVKGVEFEELQPAGSPPELAKKYYHEGADEIVFLDITASLDRRETMGEVIEKTSKNVFIPLTAGGGVKNIEDARKLFNSGADKVTVNTGAIRSPNLVDRLSNRFGSQACVVAIDAKRRPLKEDEGGDKSVIPTSSGEVWYECSIYGGNEFTGKDAIRWAKEVEKRGAGEILLTSMDRDGTKDGYDIPLTKKISKELSIPVIASGGCGNPEHIYEVFRETEASAALAASIFHYDKYSVSEVKNYLENRGISIRKVGPLDL
ncbi:imidazole glycerol phosphate synthase [candidate division MSBL1 archaeon SCGC-AAA259B11]|uniref:Imidazole glycerol phosphate synthase subunit HisF n=1 Tax=candidate division MSBL1 archaeon SCGC-AAA259B11 TaxID=1698260 RepID=A0A133U4B7_9EURY|nr:imidazole glycerol phosphate synthase [candidate division MSBL1 archaeon SCGC-AAA259B11]